jgi:hypothetical protein
MLSMLGCHLEAQLHQSLSTRLLCSVDVPQGIDHLNLSGSFDAGLPGRGYRSIFFTSF